MKNTREEPLSLEQIKESNRSAQRAASEAMEVGRETIQALSRQGESLEHSEKMSDYHSYILDKGDRTLRDMTWSGWLSNMLTSEPKPLECEDTASNKSQNGKSDDSSLSDIPTYPEDLPCEAKPTAQALQNYHCNILLLKECGTQLHELKICIDICERHKSNAQLPIQRLENQLSQLDPNVSLLFGSFTKTKSQLDYILHQYILRLSATPSSANNNNQSDNNPVTGDKSIKGNNELLHKFETEQNEHLETLSNDLRELGSLGKFMGEQFVHQNELLESLSRKNEENIEKTKMVNRRADRITRRSQVRTENPVLSAIVTIQLRPSKEFLTIDANNNSIFISTKYSGIASRFSIWKLKSSNHVIGIQSCLSNKWVNKSKWSSSMYCSANTFSYREEWEIDNANMSKTMLMCCSANYGNGGYIKIGDKGKILAASKDAMIGAQWQIQNISS